jgi:hypothetical protein
MHEPFMDGAVIRSPDPELSDKIGDIDVVGARLGAGPACHAIPQEIMPVDPSPTAVEKTVHELLRVPGSIAAEHGTRFGALIPATRAIDEVIPVTQ